MLHVPYYSNLYVKIHRLIAVRVYYCLTPTLAPDPTSAPYYPPWNINGPKRQIEYYAVARRESGENVEMKVWARGWIINTSLITWIRILVYHDFDDLEGI